MPSRTDTPSAPTETIHGVDVAALPPHPRTPTHDHYGLATPTAASAPPVVPDPDAAPVVTISRPRPTPPPPAPNDGIYNPLED